MKSCYFLSFLSFIKQCYSHQVNIEFFILKWTEHCVRCIDDYFGVPFLSY